MFIVIEGGEGAGKSTQAERLYRRLQDHRCPATLVREPGTTSLGLHLREYLKSKRPLTPQAELLLFTAARAQLIHEHIQPSLERGLTVIADRFAASTIAYQGYGRRIPIDIINYLNDYATNGLNPDLTFLLDIDPEQGLHRIGRPQLQMSLSPNAIADPNPRRHRGPTPLRGSSPILPPPSPPRLPPVGGKRPRMLAHTGRPTHRGRTGLPNLARNRPPAPRPQSPPPTAQTSKPPPCYNPKQSAHPPKRMGQYNVSRH